MHNKLKEITEIINHLYSCKFVPKNFYRDSFWVETKSSKKEFVLGIVQYGPVFRLSRVGKNNYSVLHLDTLTIRHNEIVYDVKSVLLSSGPASGFYGRKETSLSTSDFDGPDAELNLRIQFPDFSEEYIEVLKYFCANKVPKGVQIDLEVGKIMKALNGLKICVQEIELRD